MPVVEDGPRLIGKEGVVDKDLAAAILAHEVEATTLLILTDVKKVQRGYGSLHARGHRPADGARRPTALLSKGEFGAGSMGPKVEAAVGFVRPEARRSVIADLVDASAALAGRRGRRSSGGLASRTAAPTRVAEQLDDEEEEEQPHHAHQ